MGIDSLRDGTALIEAWGHVFAAPNPGIIVPLPKRLVFVVAAVVVARWAGVLSKRPPAAPDVTGARLKTSIAAFCVAC